MTVEKTIKVFVAGGTGLVGSAIIRNLQRKGYNNIIANYHRRSPKSRITDHGSRPEWVKLDLLDPQAVQAFFDKERPDYVFLAAAKVGGILANDTYRADFIYQNLQIQNNVIHQSYLHGVKKLLFLGSSCIYPRLAPQPMKEEYLLSGKLEPTNESYAIAKIAGIKMCAAYNHQYGTDFVSVMPTNLYGPNDNFDLETSHVLPALIRRFHLAKALGKNDWDTIRKDMDKNPVENVDGTATEKEILAVLDKYGIRYKNADSTPHPPRHAPHATRYVPDPPRPVEIEIWGTGKPRREFLHVDDLARACVYLMERYHADDLGEFVNIGVGEDITIKELAELVGKVVSFQGDIVWDRSKPDGTPRKLLDVSRIKELGWRPEIGLEEGIAGTYRWYLQSTQHQTHGTDQTDQIDETDQTDQRDQIDQTDQINETTRQTI